MYRDHTYSLALNKGVNMNKDILDWVIITSKLLMWGMSILAIYWLILKLTNHSPTVEELILVILGIIGGYLATITVLVFKIWGELKSMKSNLCNHTRECDRRFYALAKDFKNTDSEFRKHMMKYHQAKYS